MSEITSKVKSAAAKFNKQRADYYRYLASMLESSQGNTKMLDLFERDAQRYPNRPRGVLAGYWAAAYLNNGGNLAETWQGTLPNDEVSIIRVSQDAGDGALLAALNDVSRVAKLSDTVKNQAMATLGAAFIGISVGAFMLTLFPVFSSSKLQDIYSFLPLDQWGPRGKAFNEHAARVKDYGLYAVILIGLIGFFFAWTIDNLVGPTRDWLDKNIAIYKTIRNVKGALFLATMSTLTRRRSGGMMTLGASLSTLAQSARSPWMKWRVTEIVDRIEATGAVGIDAFNTNMISEEMFYFLRDTEEARGFSAGFEETGKYVEHTIMGEIIKSLTAYRWVLILMGAACVIGVMGWQFSVIYEMKGVMMNYYSSR